MFATMDIDNMLFNEEYELGSVWLNTFYNFSGEVLKETFTDNPVKYAYGSVTVSTHVNNPTRVAINLGSREYLEDPKISSLSRYYTDRIAAGGRLRSFFYRSKIGVGKGKAVFVKQMRDVFIYELI